MRVEGVILKDHGDIPLRRGPPRDILAPDEHTAGDDWRIAGNRPQQ
jgi:hypothetical protein